MKKIINAPEQYTDDMLKGIYAAHSDAVKYADGDLRCYCTAKKKDGKVAIITGGGTGQGRLLLPCVISNLTQPVWFVNEFVVFFLFFGYSTK